MSTTETSIASPVRNSSTVYNQVFWFSYAANFALVTANALTFRFAEFVAFLGGSEQIAGSIVSVGVAGALVARLVLGQAIDRHGTRKLWIITSLLFIAGGSLFLASHDVAPVLYVARIGFAIGLAGMFTCSIVHVQNQVPVHRRTEVIASLGSSGFVGIITGAQLGDWIFKAFPAEGTPFPILFGGTIGLGVFYLALVVYLTRRDVHRSPSETPGAHRLIFRYWPGPIVFIAVMMGMSFTVTTVFLTRFATWLHLTGVGTFFTGYALSAFVFRLWGRRWSQTIGRNRIIMMGLAGHCLGNCLLPMVTKEWHFLIPAIVCGFGHAVLFPVVISVGSGAFPKEYRGSGTTLVLGFTELGAMLSAPVLGWMIDHHGFAAMFYTTAATAVSVAIAYTLVAGRAADKEDFAVELDSAPVVNLALETDDEQIQLEPETDQPVTIPFPHLGRSA